MISEKHKIPEGFLLSGIHCGLKKNKTKNDLGLIVIPDFAKVCGFFTTNANVAYSVDVCKKSVNNPIKAVLANSGNANCFWGNTGIKDTLRVVSALAAKLKVRAENILIASTGVIGKKLQTGVMIQGLPELVKGLSGDWAAFASSIMTTDAFMKVSTAKCGPAKIFGVAKGAGMICPKMATMLSFILTDAKLPADFLRSAAKTAIDESFNSISVDGCMSTNDTVLIISSGKVPLDTARAKKEFANGLTKVCVDLAKMIVRDGEGATKLIEINVRGARTKDDAKKAVAALANSNLFKCALYGANANWGRIVAAIGHAGISLPENFVVKASDLTKDEVRLDVDLKQGECSAKMYASDLTPEYVKINAEYS